VNGCVCVCVCVCDVTHAWAHPTHTSPTLTRITLHTIRVAHTPARARTHIFTHTAHAVATKRYAEAKGAGCERLCSGMPHTVCATRIVSVRVLVRVLPGHLSACLCVGSSATRFGVRRCVVVYS